jgi:hypothetical protein
VRHAARIGARRGVHSFSVGKPERKIPLGDLGLEERIILRWIFRSGMGHELDRPGAGTDRWQELVNVVMNLRVP